MKLQNLNRSLVKILAAAATLFVISSWAVAQGQRGQWGTDGCYYAAVVNRVIPRGQTGYLQWVRQGCNFQASDGDVYYRDDRAQTWKNLRTGMVFAIAQNGRPLVQTNTGWADGPTVVEKARADRLAAAEAARRGIVGGVSSDSTRQPTQQQGVYYPLPDNNSISIILGNDPESVKRKRDADYWEKKRQDKKYNDLAAQAAVDARRYNNAVGQANADAQRAANRQADDAAAARRAADRQADAAAAARRNR